MMLSCRCRCIGQPLPTWVNIRKPASIAAAQVVRPASVCPAETRSRCGQQPGDALARVALGCEGHDPGQPCRGVEQLLHRADVCGDHRAPGCAPRNPSASLMNGPSMWMPAISRPASGSSSRSRARRASRRHIAGRSSVITVASTAATPSAASRSQAVCSAAAVSVVAVEVDAGVAVHLEVDVAGGRHAVVHAVLTSSRGSAVRESASGRLGALSRQEP